MKKIGYTALILTVVMLVFAVPGAVFAYDRDYDYSYNYRNLDDIEHIESNADGDNAQPEDVAIYIADEEIPLSNADLYSDALSPLSTFIASAVRVILFVLLIILGSLFGRRMVLNKAVSKSGR